jgi:hypothetical protein
MKHWRGFLQGPPNRPNDDIYGLLDVSTFLDVVGKVVEV